MSSEPLSAVRKNMTVCPKCGRTVLARRLDAHTDGPECTSIQNRKAAEAEGLVAPSDRGTTTSTVAMLARHAGIELERRHIRFDSVGKKTYAIFVAPIWLCTLARELRRRPRNLGGYIAPIPLALLGRLKDAVTDERLREALLTQVIIKSRLK